MLAMEPFVGPDCVDLHVLKHDEPRALRVALAFARPGPAFEIAADLRAAFVDLT